MMLAPGDLGRYPVHPLLWATVAAMVLIEVIFWAETERLLGPGFGRYPVYAHFAFHDPLFELARQDGILTTQLLWSLLSHAFLHGGVLHLAFNAAALLGLAHAISRIGGIWAFVAVFTAAAAAGAIAFGLIAETQAPLVGASGAVFGLLATITAWQERALRDRGLSRTAIWQRIGGLALLNLVMFYGLGGMLAWEAHLGGFIAGWVLAPLFPPRAFMERDA